MDMHNLTKITLAWELFETGMPQTHIAHQLGMNRDTIRVWMHGIQRNGLPAFCDAYVHAKQGVRTSRKLSIHLKERIWRMREHERECCGQKIQTLLKHDAGIHLGLATIYKVLGEKYILRSRWKKRHTGHAPTATAPRQVVQMDTVDFGDLYAFTAVDIFTREVDVLLRPSLTARDGEIFLHTCMERRFTHHVSCIQTDGGSEFKAEFHTTTEDYCEYHRYARPYRKNEQSYIESFNRSLRKECLGWTKYRRKHLPELTREVTTYLQWYHERRPHCGLNLQTPQSWINERSRLPDI